MMSLMKDDRSKRKIDFSEPFTLVLTNNAYFRYKNISRNVRVISVPDFTVVGKSVYLVSVAMSLKGVYLKNSSQKLAISHTKFFFFTEKSKNRREKKLGGHFGQRN